MLKFLCQTINGKVTLDFVFELERAKEYQDWCENPMEVIYCDMERLHELSLKYNNINEYTPVGTVEYVMEFCKLFIDINADKLIKPINVPYCLMCKEYSGRHIENGNLLNTALFEQSEIFIKSNDKIKSDYNGIYSIDKVLNLPDEDYQISSLVSIESEYRCFVYRGKMVGLQWYSGDFTLFPDIESIKKMIALFEKENTNKIPSYTMDVYITKEDNAYHTYVMEMHEFFSCGLYGFSDYKIYPYMLSRTFTNIKNRLRNGK